MFLGDIGFGGKQKKKKEINNKNKNKKSKLYNILEMKYLTHIPVYS